MFANPQDPDDEPEDDGYIFGAFDLKVLIGTALIAWALATSIGLAIYLSQS